MSFEGYYQMLCEKGHLTLADAYIKYEYDSCCANDGDCGCKFVWSNLVDDTSNDEVGKIELEVEHERRTVQCKHCHSVLVAEETRYKIPNK